MTPQPVASVPKEIAPVFAVNPPAQPSIDFSQLLGSSNDSASVQPSSGATPLAPASDTMSIHPLHARHRHDEADAANAAAAYVPPPLAQHLPGKGAANATATSAASSTGATTQAAPPAAAAQSSTAANNNGSGNGSAQNAQATPQPPGAAELEARIAVGAPTYLSQPNPAIAGLLHQQGAGPKGPEGGTADTASAAPASGDDAAAASVAAAKFDAAQQPGAALAAAHEAASDGDVTQQTDADASALSGAADASAAGTSAAVAATTLPTQDGSATQTAAAPQSTGAQPAAAAQALPAYEQVAVNLRQAAQAGTDRIEIQLKPASLGAIHVKLDVTHDGHISAVISADRSDTLNMLRQDSSNLTQALRDAGLQADSGSLSFNLRGDAQSFAQNPQSQTAGPASANSGSDSQSATSDTPQPRYRSHAGALDIEV